MSQLIAGIGTACVMRAKTWPTFPWPTIAAVVVASTLWGLSLAVLTEGAAAQQRAPDERSKPGEAPKADQGAPGRDQPKAQPQRRAAPPGGRGAAAPKALPVEKYASPEARDRLLADLYAQLATAADEKAAAQHALAIERLWASGTSDTAQVFIERAGVAMANSDPALAQDFLNQAVAIAPDQPEPWARRAYFHVADNNIKAAIGDLRRVIALEPQHFRALSTLAGLLKEVNEKPAALKIARQLQDVHPLMAGLEALLADLTRAVEGQGT